MPKEINIREIKKPQASPGAREIRVSGGSGGSSGSSPRPESTSIPSEPTQSFISRFLDIMVCDIMQKLHLPLTPFQENLVQKQKDFEKFEEFCERARGERR